jgi:Leucine-rich repeat (LRR) protein
MMDNELILQGGVYGAMAILTAEWSEAIGHQLLREHIVELELNYAAGWKGKDIAFLSSLPNLEALTVVDWTIDDVKPIHLLHKLRTLKISTYCKTEIDFAAFPKLEDCSLEWRPKAISIFDCKTLKKLFVNRYKLHETELFGRLPNLEELAILNAPVKNLLGLSRLRRLRKLRLAGLRVLTSLKGIESLTNLEELDINTCRKIRSIKEVGNLARLRKLFLNDNGQIQSIKPIDELRNLESVLFWGSTEIVDGDLSPLTRQEHLTKVTFQNRRHYSHSRDELRVA